MHEAFQFLVKKRSNTSVRKLGRQETASTSYSVGRSDSVQSWGSQDLAGTLSDLCCSDSESPAPKRRGSISPYLVGPGTPPPIDIPGLTLDNHNGDLNKVQPKEPTEENTLNSGKKNSKAEPAVDEKKKKR